LDSRYLKGYPRLSTILNNKFMLKLHSLLPDVSRPQTPAMNTYAAFIDITGIGSNYPYTGMDILNSKEIAYKQLVLFSGFVHTEFSNLPQHSRHQIVWQHATAISKLVSGNGIKLDTKELLSLDSNKINLHIKTYKSHPIDLERKRYYEGWYVTSQNGIRRRYQLQKIYDAYGKEFALEIHSFIENYAIKKIDSSLRSTLELLIILFSEFALVIDNVEELKFSLNHGNSYYFMLNIYHRFFAKRIANGGQAHAAIKDWSRMVEKYMNCFVDTGLFEEPLYPIVVPKFKKPKEDNKALPSGGSFTKEEQEQLYGGIPLYIKDEEAVTKIQMRLENEFSHIKQALDNYVDSYILNYKKLESQIGNVRTQPQGLRMAEKDGVKCGIGYSANTLATLKHYGIDQCFNSVIDINGNITNQRKFTDYILGINKKREAFNELYRVNKNFIIAIYALLVLENPAITPSWFEAWELYDKHGNLIGYKQVGNHWIISSFKKRKGTTQAQQDIVLTNRSKYLVETFIDMTSFERNCLKAMSDDNWRFAPLYASTTKINIVSNLSGAMFNNVETSGLSDLKKVFSEVQYNENGQAYLSIDEINALTSVFSLRNIRKKKGIHTYLVTRSIQEVSNKLGHKQVNLEVLEAYLPQALLNFFNDRWVRIFQNSLMFEAMKDSDLLNEAFDFKIENLEQFLENHRMRNFPAHMMEVESTKTKEEEEEIKKKLDVLVFMISPSILQMLIAIRTIVEEYNETIPESVKYWYMSAVFILSQYECKDKSKRIVNVDSTIDFYNRALTQPLDIDKVRQGIFA